MKYALIDQNMVIQVSESEFPVAPPMFWKECKDNIKRGDYYHENKFKTKEEFLPLEDVKAAKKADLKNSLLMYLSNGLEIKNVKIGLDIETRVNLLAKLELVRLGAIKTPIKWTEINKDSGETTTLSFKTVDEFQEFAVNIGVAGEKIIRKYKNAKETLDKLQTNSEVAEFDVDFYSGGNNT